MKAAAGGNKEWRGERTRFDRARNGTGNSPRRGEEGGNSHMGVSRRTSPLGALLPDNIASLYLSPCMFDGFFAH